MNSSFPLNSLYFYPHKIRYTPSPEVDDERRGNWSPGYYIHGASPMRRHVHTAGSPQRPQRDPTSLGRIELEIQGDNMDDDGAPPLC